MFRMLLRLSLVLLLIAPAAAFADEAVAEGAPVAETEAPAPEAAVPDRIASFSATLDVTSAYYFRGIVQETSGLILQPGAELSLSLYEGEGALSSFSFAAGLWSSVHTGPSGTPAGDGPKGWYEADIYAGFGLGFGGLVDLSLGWAVLTSPNGNFSSVHELNVGLGLADGDLWAARAPWFGGINPSVSLAVELAGTSFGDDRGIFLGVGIAPGFTLVDTAVVSLGLEIAPSVGLSPGGYYVFEGENDLFGYFDAFAGLTLGLPVIPERAGAWSVSVGGGATVLGKSTKAANGDEGAVGYVGGGVAVEF